MFVSHQTTAGAVAPLARSCRRYFRIAALRDVRRLLRGAIFCLPLIVPGKTLAQFWSNSATSDERL
jgi:hypothetical protein